MRFLLIFGWIMAMVYATIPIFWLMIHPFAERLRQVGSRVIVYMSLVWLVVIGGVAALTYRWFDVRLYATPWAWLGWLALVLAAVRTYRGMGKDFSGNQLIGRPEVETGQQQRLVVTGIHSRMRHPIYLAHLSMLTAWAVGTGSVAIWGLWAFAIISGFFMVRAEEAELERRFGDEYRQYKARVPAIFPSLGLK